ncbi:gamma subclass chorismate mutase AroQ [Pseudonocardia phyllosphaerae]|uniref:gamma subclass chorismate mutase AroQ n=1 Tax=Pseudonocardia phyllosphaerae TaxID=3390502 RepID=UPI00397E315B
MSGHRSPAHAVLRCAAATALAVAALAGCGAQAPPITAGPPGASPADGLTRIAGLAAERAVLSDRVAIAKSATGGAITDPPREAAVLAGARASAVRDGVDPEWVARVVADQIAASTQVQDALTKQWAEHPDTRPAQRVDLATVRPELDRIGRELVAALKVAQPARANEDCPSSLAQAAVAAAGPLDDVHKAALGRALHSVCDRSSDS